LNHPAGLQFTAARQEEKATVMPTIRYQKGAALSRSSYLLKKKQIISSPTNPCYVFGNPWHPFARRHCPVLTHRVYDFERPVIRSPVESEPATWKGTVTQGIQG
jgi:hypothetical protein